MKFNIKLLFNNEFTAKLVEANAAECYLELTLTDDIFDNLQNIKDIIKKYILSEIFSITKITVDTTNVQSEAQIQSAIMLDTVITIAINKCENIKQIVYESEDINNLNKEHKLFKTLIIKYLDLLYSTPNDINPETLPSRLIEICKDLIQDKNFIFKEIIAEADTFPLLHAVGRAGNKAPRLLLCGFGVNNEHDFINTEYKVCLIGKGVTFDSGGYCLKPAASMIDMSIDKSGSIMAFFTGLFNYLAFGIKCIYVSPVVQNFISDKAYLPGDIITSKLGVKVHIENTDAEGRLILADAVEYAVSNFKFNYCFEFSTLTGAAIITLGYGRTAYITSSDELSNTITSISSYYGEKIHRLPNDKYFLKLLMSNIRHQKVLNNLSAPLRSAGTITGGVFIEHFYNNAHAKLNKTMPPFCHFDIASLINLNYFDTLSYSYNLLFISQLCKRI